MEETSFESFDQRKRSTFSQVLPSVTTEPRIHEPTCLFTQWQPRDLAIDYASIVPSNIKDAKEALRPTRSSAESFSNLLLSRNSHTQERNSADIFPLQCLYRIFERDMTEMLPLMHETLSDLAHDILDDTRIQDRLTYWRSLLQKLDIELFDLESTVHKLSTFMSKSKGSTDGASLGESATGTNFGGLLQQISILHRRVEKSSKSLTANMSILESKRGIAEAESVTKLTELAFFFIPLTFSASIFSMQVKELESSSISISTFFTVAILITASSYALRLAIRSSLFKDARRNLLDRVRKDAGLSAGSPISTRDVIAWLWHRFFRDSVFGFSMALLCIMGFVVSGVLLAALWTRPLERGIKVAATACLCLLCFTCVASFASRRIVRQYVQNRQAKRRRT